MVRKRLGQKRLCAKTSINLIYITTQYTWNWHFVKFHANPTTGKLISKAVHETIRNYLANNTYSTHFKHKNTTRDLCLGGTNSAVFVNAIQYFYLVRCGAVHICSHIRFINRFLMSEDGSPLSLPFTSKTGQSHSVAQNRQTSFSFFFCTLLASNEKTCFGIL